MKMKIYISGPITGVEREEYMENFRRAEQYAKKAFSMSRFRGKVVNPAKFLPARWPWLYRIVGYRLMLLYDLWRVMQCDTIYMMRGWKDSRGALLEHATACAFGLRVVYEPQPANSEQPPANDKLDEEIEKFKTYNGFYKNQMAIEYTARHFAYWEEKQLLNKLANMPWDKAIEYIVKRKHDATT